MNETFKKYIIIIGTAIGIAVIFFLGGYFFSNYKWSKKVSDSGNNVRTDLSEIEQQYKLAKSSLDSANSKIEQLESTISDIGRIAGENNELITQVKDSSINATGTIDEIIGLWTEYTNLVERLQENNRGIEDRSKSSIGETSGK